jgi:probable F420-dependent oxidoreductase
VWGAFQGEHALDFHGEFYTLDYLTPAVNPGPLHVGPPSIYLAAFGELMYSTAGAVADGAIVHPIHSVEYLRAVAEPALAKGLEQAGRTRGDFDLMVTVLAIVGDGEGEGCRESVRRQFGFYASTPAYRPVLELHGRGELSDRLRELVRQGQHDALASAVPDDALDEFCVVADGWEEAMVVARRRYEGIADRVTFQSAPPLTVGAARVSQGAGA